MRFRLLIDQHKWRYMKATKTDKEELADELVTLWRNQNPPGRFVTKTDPSKGDDSLWHDIGNAAARKKILNSLRQQIPTQDFLTVMQRQVDTPSRLSSTLSSQVGEASFSAHATHPLPFESQYLQDTQATHQGATSSCQLQSHSTLRQADQQQYHIQKKVLPFYSEQHKFAAQAELQAVQPLDTSQQQQRTMEEHAMLPQRRTLSFEDKPRADRDWFETEQLQSGQLQERLREFDRHQEGIQSHQQEYGGHQQRVQEPEEKQQGQANFDQQGRQHEAQEEQHQKRQRHSRHPLGLSSARSHANQNQTNPQHQGQPHSPSAAQTLATLRAPNYRRNEWVASLPTAAHLTEIFNSSPSDTDGSP